MAGASDRSANPLPDDNRIRSAEDARILVARRNRALDALGLNDAKTDVVEAELRALGWPTDLASNTPRERAGLTQKDHWLENDTRALLCLKRHAAQLSTAVIQEHFFSSRASLTKDDAARLVRAKYLALRTRDIKSWDSNNDAVLKEAYDGGKKQFDDMASEGSFNTHKHRFSALELETRYAQIVEGEKAENLSNFQGKGKGKQVESELSDDDGDENGDGGEEEG